MAAVESREVYLALLIERVEHAYRNFTNYRLRLLLHCGVYWHTALHDTTPWPAATLGCVGSDIRGPSD